jgi:hypothetical protein
MRHMAMMLLSPTPLKKVSRFLLNPSRPISRASMTAGRAATGRELVEGELDPLQGQPGTGTDEEGKKDQKGQQGSGTGWV